MNCERLNTKQAPKLSTINVVNAYVLDFIKQERFNKIGRIILSSPKKYSLLIQF